MHRQRERGRDENEKKYLSKTEQCLCFKNINKSLYLSLDSIHRMKVASHPPTCRRQGLDRSGILSHLSNCSFMR